MGVGLSVVDANQLIESKQIDIILDVRTLEEWNESHHPQAIHLSVDRVEKEFHKLYPNKEIKVLVYCRSGARASKAVQGLQEQGYTNVKYIDFPFTYLFDN